MKKTKQNPLAFGFGFQRKIRLKLTPQNTTKEGPGLTLSLETGR